MKAVTSVAIEAGGRLKHLHCQPPLTVRQVTADDAATCSLCLVGTAAGPLAGDDLTLDLALLDGARATVRAAGASLVQGGGGDRTMRTAVALGEDAALSARPGAVIVAAGSHIDVAVAIDLAAGAAVDWQEIVVLGRTGEPPGTATLRWDVTRCGRAVLRQSVDLAEPALTAWAGLTKHARVLATALVSDPTLTARTVVASSTAVAARLDEHTLLITVLGRDAATARRELDDLCARARPAARAS